MAVELPSFPRDNSLEALRVAVEEKKQEVKNKFSELKKLLQLSEDTATEKLDKTYTDIRDTLMKHQTNLAQLEKSKNFLRTTLADNNILQTALQGIDPQIAEARNSVSTVPKHILLRWRNEDVRQCFENMCEVISSKTGDLPAPTLQPNEAKYKTEPDSLQTKNATEKKDFQKREEGYKQIIAKMDKELQEKKKEIIYKTEQIKLDKNQEKALRKQVEDFEEQTQRSRDQISTLQQLVEAKDHQISILRSNLDDAIKEIESYRLHTQANPIKVQSEQETIGVEKNLQHSKAELTQPSRYKLSTLLINQQSSQFYTLNQVQDHASLLGELVACRARNKSEYVIGTLQVVILPKYKHEQTIAGIEFLDQFGDSNGFYKGVSYFKANYRYATFLPTNEVYIVYNKQGESLK